MRRIAPCRPTVSQPDRGTKIATDVAYRRFATPRRVFVVADCPGHERHAADMAAAASTSDLAVLLVDVRKGLLARTRRHAAMISLLGVQRLVLAVNKMDLVDYDQAPYDEIVAEFERFAEPLRFRSVVPIPVSARFGDNVSAATPRTPWHSGPTLRSCLETVDAGDAIEEQPMRMVIEGIDRAHPDFRGFAGMLVSGRIRVGDEIVIASSGCETSVARMASMDGDIDCAEAAASATVVFSDEIEASSGDIVCHAKERPHVADQFAAHLIWLSEEPLLPGRSYVLEINSRTVPATVTNIKHRLDIVSLSRAPAKTLSLNDIGFCNISASAPIAFDSHEQNRKTGAFTLLDRFTNATAATGVISFPLRRATNIHLQELTVSRTARSSIKRQRPTILWFTSLSGAGKSTVANLVEAELVERRAHTMLLDGDNVRHGLNRDLGFTEADRVENIRRIGEVAKLMVEAGLIVLCSFISPFKAERRVIRELVEDGEFIEIFLDAPLDVCIARDPKGLYSVRWLERSRISPGSTRSMSDRKIRSCILRRPNILRAKLGIRSFVTSSQTPLSRTLASRSFGVAAIPGESATMQYARLAGDDADCEKSSCSNDRATGLSAAPLSSRTRPVGMPAGRRLPRRRREHGVGGP